MENQFIFNNVNLNELFLKQGYLIIDRVDVLKLKTLASTLYPKAKNFNSMQNKFVAVDYHCTFLSSQVEYKSEVFIKLKEVFEPLLNQYLNNFKIIQANIFNKTPGSGTVCPHQNLTTVDETKYTSISIWTPLVDTTKENGALHFSPSSQRKFEKYRNSTINWEPLNTSSDISEFKMKCIDMKAGEVIVFDDSIIHASPINTSKEDRITFHCICIPKEAHPIYCKDVGNSIQIIEVADDFWQFHCPGDNEPTKPVLKTVKKLKKKYTLQSIQSEIQEIGQ